jgi:hypothetical protein
MGSSCARAALREMAGCLVISGFPHLAASMWDAGAVAPCQCVRRFTHLKEKWMQLLALGRTAVAEFQDRCLKPLGHPSPSTQHVVVVIVSARRMGEKPAHATCAF